MLKLLLVFALYMFFPHRPKHIDLSGRHCKYLNECHLYKLMTSICWSWYMLPPTLLKLSCISISFFLFFLYWIWVTFQLTILLKILYTWEELMRCTCSRIPWCHWIRIMNADGSALSVWLYLYVEQSALDSTI